MSESVGQQNFASDLTDVNAISFAVKQALSRVQTGMPCLVKTCTNAGGLTPVGYVDVQPLVNMIDGAGQATQHGIVHNLPYCRLQGGANAIVMDPQPGDIGLVVFASRDISSVKANKAPSNPGSFRRHDFADGMYVQGALNGTPTQYLQFNAAGISIVSPAAVTISAGSVSLEIGSGGFTLSGGALISDHDGTFDGISVDLHVHGSVAAGGAETGMPVA